MLIALEPVKQDLPQVEEALAETGRTLNLDALRERSSELERESQDPGFWNDQEKARDILKDKSRLDSKIRRFEGLDRELSDLKELIELAEEMDEESETGEITATFEKLKSDIDSFRLETLLNGKYDANDAILTVHAGAGGVEAMDWAEMLFRMYTRWAAQKGYDVDVVDLQDDTDAGIKSATFFVKGENAYGYLKHEQGVHRLVRISPFNAAGKRQTSFASLEVMPSINEDLSVEINPEDLRIDTYRSSGAGGQHVNKTDSAIRITHIPTNIVVTCQNERSQHQNKEVAMQILMAKLADLKEREHKETLKELKGDFSQIAWGSQIRSYVFQPYTMVKDHRTGAEVGNVYGVMDGDLTPFINAELRELANNE